MLLCLTLGAISPVLSILAAYDMFGRYSSLVSIVSTLVYPFTIIVYFYLITFVFLKWKTINPRMLKKYILEWLLVLICVLLFLWVGDIYWNTYQPALYRSSSTDCF